MTPPLIVGVVVGGFGCASDICEQGNNLAGDKKIKNRRWVYVGGD